MARFQSGNLWKALAVSALVHGLLLASSWPHRPAADAIAAQLRATLRPKAAVALPSAPAAPQESAAGRHRLAAVTPAALPTPPPQLAEPLLENSTAESGRRSNGAHGEAMAAAAAATAAGVAGATLDAEGLRGYRLALAVQARQFKRYPERALEAGWDGTSEVRVAVAAGGKAQTPELVRSSGHAVLDEAAIEMLRQAAARTPVPDALRNQAFAVSVPVTFDLPD